MAKRLIIRNGTVIDPTRSVTLSLEVLVEGGVVAELLQPGVEVTDAEVIDASGCWVVPGLIDMHVHLREPGQEYKETIATGTSAAISGGVAAVVCMANLDPVNDNTSVTDSILNKAREADKARVYPVGAVTRGQEGESLTEISELIEHGCIAVSDDGRPVMDDELMRKALENCLALDVPLLSHPEDLKLSTGGCMNEGKISTELGLIGIPAAAEEAMVARDINLCELTGARLHLQHVSTAGSVRLVREAKARGVKVTAETCPHYFTLTDEVVRSLDPNFKMNPPLRSEADREAVTRGLADATIDAIASDHAPHEAAEKQVDFDRAANGIVGLETLLPLSLNLVREGHVSQERLVELLSVNPARILGVQGGSLQPGTVADITIFDPEQEWTVDASKFYSKARNTPFNGWTVKGKAKEVIIGGKVIKP